MSADDTARVETVSQRDRRSGYVPAGGPPAHYRRRHRPVQMTTVAQLLEPVMNCAGTLEPPR